MGNCFAPRSPSTDYTSIPTLRLCRNATLPTTQCAFQPKVSFSMEARTLKTPEIPKTRWYALAAQSVKEAVVHAWDDAMASFAGTSIVISRLEETWIENMVDGIDATRTRRRNVREYSHEMDESSQFLTPADTIIVTIGDGSRLAAVDKPWPSSAHKWDRPYPRDVHDDCASCTTDDTEMLSDDDEDTRRTEFDHDFYGFSDDEEEDEDEEYEDAEERIEKTLAMTHPGPYYAEEEPVECRADALLRLSSQWLDKQSRDACALPQVYVSDYLCPCGECPAYHRIATDVARLVTWRNSFERRSITRVLQAFSTYNEAVPYTSDLIETAEACLNTWLGDEDRALSSLVVLLEHVPALCH